MTETLVAPEFTNRGGRTGSYWIDVSEMLPLDCSLCGGTHQLFECPACGAEHVNTLGEDSIGCWCGATLRVSDSAAEEFRKMYGF